MYVDIHITGNLCTWRKAYHAKIHWNILYSFDWTLVYCFLVLTMLITDTSFVIYYVCNQGSIKARVFEEKGAKETR